MTNKNANIFHLISFTLHFQAPTGVYYFRFMGKETETHSGERNGSKTHSLDDRLWKDLILDFSLSPSATQGAGTFVVHGGVGREEESVSSHT